MVSLNTLKPVKGGSDGIKLTSLKLVDPPVSPPTKDVGATVVDVRKVRELELPQVESDEGREVSSTGEHVSYLDSLNLPTGGKGHLLSKSEIKKYPSGTAIPQSVVDGWFKVDLAEAHDDLDRLVKDHKVDVPPEVEQILFNMVFNMGRSRLGKFKGMWAHLKNKDYDKAADEMVDSDWFGQVKGRSKRLVERMRSFK